MLGFFVVLTLLLVLSPLVYTSSSDLKLTFGSDGLHVSGMYSTTIPYDDIGQLTVEQQLPRLKLRTNGFSLGATKIGHFLTKDNQKVMLFAHSYGCCIKIVCQNGKTYYLNYKQTADTMKAFESLKSATGK